MSLPSDHFPVLQTERCLLRRIERSDQQKIFEGLSHPEVIPYYGVSYQSFEATAAQMDFYDGLLQNGTGIWWAVCLNDAASSFMGACGFNDLRKEHRRAEIGFWLLPQYHNNGFMSEALAAAIHYGFTAMGLHRIEAIVEAGNKKSSTLLTKFDFVFEGTHRECEIKNGKFIDLEYFALLNTRTPLPDVSDKKHSGSQSGSNQK